MPRPRRPACYEGLRHRHHRLATVYALTRGQACGKAVIFFTARRVARP